MRRLGCFPGAWSTSHLQVTSLHLKSWTSLSASFSHFLLIFFLVRERSAYCCVARETKTSDAMTGNMLRVSFEGAGWSSIRLSQHPSTIQLSRHLSTIHQVTGIWYQLTPVYWYARVYTRSGMRFVHQQPTSLPDIPNHLVLINERGGYGGPHAPRPVVIGKKPRRVSHQEMRRAVESPLKRP